MRFATTQFIGRRSAKFALGGLLVATVAFATGCESTNTYGTSDQVITDGWLATKARVEVIRTARTPAGLLEFQAEVFNDTPLDRSFVWRVDWIDERGMRLRSSIEGWARMQINAKQTEFIGGIAPDPRAVDFKLYVDAAK